MNPYKHIRIDICVKSFNLSSSVCGETWMLILITFVSDLSNKHADFDYSRL